MMKQPKRLDWHPAIICAQLRIRGTSLRKLAKEYDFSPTALTKAIQHPWPKAERIIANAIGVEPSEIWPSRYAHRAAKQARIAAKKAALNSIKQCSHDCNVCVTEGN